MSKMGNWLIFLGFFLVFSGVLLKFLPKLGVGHLPGDILIEKDNFTFYFPVTTSIIISLVLTIIFTLMR